MCSERKLFNVRHADVGTTPVGNVFRNDANLKEVAKYSCLVSTQYEYIIGK